MASNLTIVTPYPLSPGDSRIIFDIVGRGIGLSRSECNVLSLIQEPPEGKNGTITDDQRGRYEAGFRAALAADQSPVLVLLDIGGSPLLRTFGLVPSGIERLRGYILEPADCRAAPTRERVVVGQYKSNCKGGAKGDDKYGWATTERRIDLSRCARWIVPTLHPKIIRSEGLKSIPCLNADLGRALRLAQGVGSPVEFGYQTEQMPSGDAIAFDIETPRGFLELIGASDGTTTWAARWNPDTADKINRTLRVEGRTAIFHNASFDIPWLGREGIQVCGPVFDTMLAAHLIQPDLYKSLEKSSTLYLDLRPFKHLSTSELARPAADAQVSALMYFKQRDILEKTGQLALFCDTIMPATRVLMGMTKHGIRVDQDRLAVWQAELGSKLQGLMAEWYAITPTNPFSHSQLKRYLYEGLGLPRQFTKYEGVTADEGAIKALMEKSDRPELSLLLQIRETAKMKSTYSEVEIGPDGCVHPSYLPESKDTDAAGAATGRLASRGPNIQNQPAEARRLFVPHEEGMVLVEADFSQIELRVACALSGDRGLADSLGRTDPFVGIMQVLACDRTRAKNVVYGSLYGAGPRKLAALLRANGIPTNEAECRGLQDRLAQAYPQLWGWRTTVAREAAENRVLTNPFGRRRYFYGGSKDAPAAIDYLPQSTAADILWETLRDVGEMDGRGGTLLTTVHDSLLFECEQGSVGSFVEVLRCLLEREWPQIAPGFRVPVKVKVGKNWKEMCDYDSAGAREEPKDTSRVA